MRRLTCAFGSPWGSKGCGPCAKCREWSERLAVEFQRGVFFGDWDETGRKPSEQKVRSRR